ncbi:hypothetical protein EUX98_g846 [Antrodiella citrinella]|uniref:Uncharacterized protein n=1 Tax=Antrodiella citrinella TaxID=2447956 RepID=A0A4S4N4J1_9APHY|nr:hypothetical protein EUX98_g846 [Antrodiella citrinella]
MSTVYIESTKTSLPSRTPYLMPFHVGYSGPAPVSTYFHVKSVPPPTYGAVKEETESKLNEAQVITDSQDTVLDKVPASASASTLESLPAIATASSSSTLVDEASAATENISKNFLQCHFTAAFRGRAMSGLEVDLPQGYIGLVLRAPGANETSSRSRSDEEFVGSRRKSRRGLQYAVKEEEAAKSTKQGDEEMHDWTEDAEEPRRLLQPTAMFSSFILWNPDIPVDEGRDEYIRSLTEWTRLSAEIHRYE